MFFSPVSKPTSFKNTGNFMVLLSGGFDTPCATNAPGYSTTRLSQRRMHEHHTIAYRWNYRFCVAYPQRCISWCYLFYAKKDGCRQPVAVHHGHGDDVPY